MPPLMVTQKFYFNLDNRTFYAIIYTVVSYFVLLLKEIFMLKTKMTKADLHALAGEMECGVCGEWVSDEDIIIATDCNGQRNVCWECLHETGEFKTCTSCGSTFHVDLMHDDEWCKTCFREEQLSVDERYS